jgi:hypothetical protein
MCYTGKYNQGRKAMTNLYHLSALGAAYRITKLDPSYHVESSYIVSLKECSCPAGPRPTCRHRQMLPFFLAKGHIADGWMLDWHTRQWRKPLCEDRNGFPIDPPMHPDGHPEWTGKQKQGPHPLPNSEGDSRVILSPSPAEVEHESTASAPSAGPIRRRRIP